MTLCVKFDTRHNNLLDETIRMLPKKMHTKTESGSNRHIYDGFPITGQSVGDFLNPALLGHAPEIWLRYASGFRILS